MKDKLGHGSEAHREFHRPQVEHGQQERGTHAHGDLEQLNAWGQTAATAKRVRAEIRHARKFQLHKPPSQRRSLP